MDRRTEGVSDTSEGHSRALLANVSDMITVSDRDGKITYANPATEQVSGFTPEEFMAQDPFDLIHPEDRPRCEEAFKKLVRNPGLSLDSQHRVRHKDGTWRWVEGTFTSLFDDPEVGGLVATVRDITERKQAEEALRESEERLKAALHAGRMAWWDWNPATDQVTASDTMDDLFGLIPGQTFQSSAQGFQLVHPDDVDRHRALVEPAAERGESWHSEFRIIRPRDGAIAWLEERATAKRDPQTGVVHMTGIVWDITERKLAEDALGASEERFRMLVENIRDYAIFMLDADGIVTGWPEGARRVKGYAAEEAIGRHVSMFYTPEAVAAGEPERELAQAAEEGRAEREGWRVRKNGERIWVNEIATAVRDAGGKLVGFTKISRDLTERRRAEEALRESEERLRLAVDAARLGCWEFIIETAELRGDEAFNEHHGAPPDSELGFEGHLEAIHPEDHEPVRREVARALEEGSEYEIEYRVPRPGGKTRWILSRGRFVRGGGSAPDRLVGVTLDVTEGRELERERERLRALELAAHAEAMERKRISRDLHDRVAHSMGVAHQSLQLHRAYAQKDSPLAAEKLQLAREATRRALDQTRNLSSELARSHVEETREGVVAAVRALLETHVPPGVDATLSASGDESSVPALVGEQVYLVMREAVRNAVAHSGCERIRAALEVQDGELYGRVEDDGAGFDPGGKLAPGRSEEDSPRSGVGLRSMRERAELLGGKLVVASKPGRGTRVEVRVPLG